MESFAAVVLEWVERCLVSPIGVIVKMEGDAAQEQMLQYLLGQQSVESSAFAQLQPLVQVQSEVVRVKYQVKVVVDSLIVVGFAVFAVAAVAVVLKVLVAFAAALQRAVAAVVEVVAAGTFVVVVVAAAANYLVT